MIGIIGFANLDIMPYLRKYTDVLDENNINYDIVYWNRDGILEKKDFNGNAICYSYEMKTHQPFYKKIGGFVRYTNFIRKTIKKRKYDKLILLTSQTAVPISDILLCKKYSGKYVYDYRDITKEKNKLYKRLVQKLICNSYFTGISSFGFKRVIGESDKFVKSHNCRKLAVLGSKSSKEEPINISFWGLVRSVSSNKRICDIFGNDSRFSLYYHGNGFYKEIQEYCKEKNYNNIHFSGRYSPDDVQKFADNANIIHSIYDNGTVMRNAMPNKVYDAVRYAKPIMVAKNSYMAEFLDNYSFKFDFDIENTTSDDVYEWYNQLDCKTCSKEYMKLYECIKKDDDTFTKALMSFVTL